MFQCFVGMGVFCSTEGLSMKLRMELNSPECDVPSLFTSSRRHPIQLSCMCLAIILCLLHDIPFSYFPEYKPCRSVPPRLAIRLLRICMTVYGALSYPMKTAAFSLSSESGCFHRHSLIVLIVFESIAIHANRAEISRCSGKCQQHLNPLTLLTKT
jgi:hypothetical protein